MTRAIDLTQQTFGRLTVLKKVACNPLNGNAQWLCQCRCGRQTVADSYALRHGKVKSCGCWAREKSAEVIRHNPKTRASMGHSSNLGIQNHHTDLPSRIKSKRNKSGVIGVSWNKSNQRWVAHFYYKGQYLLNKQFVHFEDAVAARRAYEQRYLAANQQ
ncbi:DUF1390 domain-containing protein [Lactiplantibacillus fabifermentans]|uniref:Uncharacterized protein n=2 Tax=Lactiplantibacillus fabifermentans TaxID=483011 RepID=A0A0R2NNT8_9LACO|nr:DUF1390 domain-containing protein [Lactiplantibacillus fabifermentans]ETY73973.1 alcohol dehydrogenase [Lactiplantibacillus fabifermentans T30PCM01]KRO27367.1 hypothetical protein DY78_GL000120 [Lactiplantibacillus fabifermentans DSM 21115]